MRALRSTAGASDLLKPRRKPSACVIVLTFNGQDRITDCLSSIADTRYDDYAVWVVDNNSSDGSVDVVHAHDPTVEIIRNHKNYGYAKGNNIALRRAQKAGFDYAVLLNDDVKVLDCMWLSAAIGAAEEDERIAMVGFAVSGEEKVGKRRDRQRVRLVSRIDGCALVIKLSALEVIGLFDERYFMYAEEDDLEARATKAGHLLAEVDVPIYHRHMAASSHYPIRMGYLQMRNSLRYCLKNRSFARILLRAVAVFEIACNPWSILYTAEDPSHRRIRGRRHYLLNAVLYLAAVGWNILFLPHTLFLRLRQLRNVIKQHRLSVPQ